MGWVKGGVLLSADVKNKKSFDRLQTILFKGPHNETSPRLVIGKLYRLLLYTVASATSDLVDKDPSKILAMLAMQS